MILDADPWTTGRHEELVDMMHWYGDGQSWWIATLMWTGMIAFWVGVVWLVYALTGGASRNGAGVVADEPRRILDARLARGEIDSDEYRRLRDVLTSTGDRTT